MVYSTPLYHAPLIHNPDEGWSNESALLESTVTKKQREDMNTVIKSLGKDDYSDFNSKQSSSINSALFSFAILEANVVLPEPDTGASALTSIARRLKRAKDNSIQDLKNQL